MSCLFILKAINVKFLNIINFNGNRMDKLICIGFNELCEIERISFSQ